MLAMLPDKAQLTPSSLTDFLTEDRWVAEPKLDGVRVLAYKTYDGDLRVLNREGKTLSHRPELFPHEQAEQAIEHVDGYLDGELMDDGTWCLFDVVPKIDGENARMRARDRRKQLEQLMSNLDADLDRLRLVVQAKGTEAKRQLLADVYHNNGEGLIFRYIGGKYVRGRSKALRKFKFTYTLDAVVVDTKLDGKDNAQVGLYVYDDLVPISRVAVHNHNVAPGDVVEVRFREISKRGRLIEPVLVRKRTDKDPGTCTSDQLLENALTYHLDAGLFAPEEAHA